MKPNRSAVGLGVCLLVGLLAFLLQLHVSVVSTGGLGFPLDDAWIHLQFARNLADWGSFSYFQDQQVTAGSSAPLYTLALSLLFRISRNEFLISYALGLTGLLLSGVVFYQLICDRTEARWAPHLMLLVFLLEARLQWAAGSGMETTPFILVLLLTLLAYRRRWMLRLALCLALAPWLRPEGVLLVPVVAADYLLGRLWWHRRESHPVRIWALGTALVVSSWLGYAAFNYALGGSPIPNTIRAKAVYYQDSPRHMGQDLVEFLLYGHLMPASLLALLGVIGLVMVRRPDPHADLTAALWVGALGGVLMLRVPFLFHDGRYFVSAIPCLLLLAWEGLRWLSRRINDIPARRALIGVGLLGLLGTSIGSDVNSFPEYAERCAYLQARQVRTARWLAANLPPGAVVATHDIGALGYYSGHRLFDVAGLITPELIPHLKERQTLTSMMAGRGVTHLAVLRSWFLVDNEPLLFETDPGQLEIMQVYPFQAGHTQVLSDELFFKLDTSERLTGAQGPATALEYLLRYQSLGQNSSLYWAAVGRLQRQLNDPKSARTSLERALVLCPTNQDACIDLAVLDAMEQGPEAAARRLDRLVSEYPGNLRALELLVQIARDGLHDASRTRVYQERLEEARRKG